MRTMDNRINWLVFDLDDTLGGVEIEGKVVGTGLAYDHVLERYQSKMATLGVAPDLALKTQNSIDIELCKTHGFADKSRFPQSLVDAYKALGGISDDTAEEISQIGWSVFTDYPYRPLPGAIETLAEVAKSFKIAIVTKGEDTEQRKKVFEMGLWPYADQTLVLSHKNHDEWEQVLSTLRLDITKQMRSWAIGNSVKSDVNVPLELGLNGMHLKAATWAFEEAPYASPMHGRRLEIISDIREVTDHVYAKAV
jgi:FMN phosphatase YigB (HAD superfamily)